MTGCCERRFSVFRTGTQDSFACFEEHVKVKVKLRILLMDPCHSRAAAWMDASDVVVCNMCGRCSENSGPDVGRKLMPLAFPNFCLAEKDDTYFLMVPGALTCVMMLRTA